MGLLLETAQWLRALPPFIKDPSSFLNTHAELHMTEDVRPPFSGHTYTHKSTYARIKLIFVKMF